MSPIRPGLRPACLLATLLVATAAGACKTDNPNFCGDGDTRPECTGIDAGIDGRTGCMANPALCMAGVETCAADDTCVDCVDGNDHQSADCTEAASPVCATNRACRACAADSECDSAFCDAGQCIATDNVIYVAANGADAGMCTMAAKCATPKFAAAKLTATRRYLRIEASPVAYRPTPDGPVLINTDAVIHAPSTILERPGGNQIIEITGGAVTIVGASIRGAAGGGGADGIKCANATLTLREASVSGSGDRGIEAAGCVLDLNRVAIFGNTAGGIRLIDGRFTIVNSFFFGNGAANAAAGGLSLNPNGMPNTLEFNTIAKNTAGNGAGDAGGLLCLGAMPIAARNNVIHANVGANEAFGTNCTHGYSVIGPGPGPGGTTVRSMTAVEVALMNPDGMLPIDFHLKPTSLLRGGAEPGSATGATAVDFDGDSRPNPLAGPADIGADEIP